MRRSYKFRAYPTARQETRARRLLADHCDLYNAALQERRDAYRHSETKIRYGEQSAQLTEIRLADPDGQGAHSFTSQQQTLRRLNTVFTAFYKRAQTGQAGYPRFKSRSRFDQVGFVAGDGLEMGTRHRHVGARQAAGGRHHQGQAAPAGPGHGQDDPTQAGAPPLVPHRRRRPGTRAAARDRAAGRY